MRKLIKMEMKKAICSKFFLMGMGFLLLFALLSAWYMVENWMLYNPDIVLSERFYIDGKYVKNPDIALFSFHGAWIGGEILSLASMVFFRLVPIAAAIPYGWTFCRELKSGYMKNVASRVNKKKYIFAKALAVFTSGALAVLIPLIVNVLLVSAFIPYNDPYVTDSAYNYTDYGQLWSDIYFNNQLLFVILHLLLDGLYGGIFALLSFSVSFYIKNVLAAMFFPFIATLVLGYLNSNLWTNLPGRMPRCINPVDFIAPLHGGITVWWIVLLVTAILLSFIIATIVLKGFKDEVF